jgi:hypothetical protein
MFNCSSLGALLIITLGPKANKNTGDIRTILTRVIMEHMSYYENLVRMKIQRKITDMRSFGIGSRQLLSNAIDKRFTGTNFKYAIITNIVYDIIGMDRMVYPEGAVREKRFGKGKVKQVNVSGKSVTPDRDDLNEEAQGTLSVIEVAVSEFLDEYDSKLKTYSFRLLNRKRVEELTSKEIEELPDRDKKNRLFQLEFKSDLHMAIKMWVSSDKVISLKEEMNRVIVDQIEESLR